MSERETITRLLRRWSAGDSDAFDALMEVAYSRLHRIARQRLRKEEQGNALQATDILHEALLRLMDLEGLDWNDRAHFYAMAAKMMRRILVDHARGQNRLKRGGDTLRVTLAEAEVLALDGHSPELEALDIALDRLAAHDQLKADLVELRFFVGLTGEEIARCLGISTATVQREWRRARTWLYAELKGEALGG